jgi:D-cysteine desulfhydrase
MLSTPIEPLPHLSVELRLDLRVKRDDVFPWAGGGTKARKALAIGRVIEREGCDAIVTTGGLQSNHVRAMALLAASRGWRMAAILHGNPEMLDQPQGNLLLCRLLGVAVRVVPPDEIAVEMTGAAQRLASEGYRPYTVPGGGHCASGAQALVDAMDELSSQCYDLDWRPDYIVHASGTGTTQAGIMAGLDLLSWPTRVIGISVARRNPRGGEVVREAYEQARQRLGIQAPPRALEFRDEWVGAGYEQAGECVLRTIRRAARSDALILDPTYTGKAFCALLDLASDGYLPTGARVLFWHTGGLLNLMAYDNVKDLLL